MQFEEFNKKIKEAAEQHHPAYNEQAWQKMEKLLDQHLPQKEKDRRRFIFFILFFLFLGGAVFIGIDKPWQKNKTAANRSNDTVQQNDKPQPDQKTNGRKEDNGTVTLKEQDQLQQGSAGNANAKQQSESQQLSIDNSKQQNNLVSFGMNPKESRIKKKSIIEQGNVVVDDRKQNAGSELKKDNAASNSPISKKDDAVSSNAVSIDENAKNSSGAVKNDEKKIAAENKTEEKSSAAAKKNKTGKKNFLADLTFSLSAGPDVSKAGNSRFGKITGAYGAGIGYTWKKFTLRTGVYSASKIYSADENEYDLNYALPPNVKFEGADANCRVTEIPFTLSYNFAAKNNHSWFVGAGLSSYLMNREDYKYWYSNSGTGTYYSRSFEFKNRNKHYFSVIDLSAGYTRKLNNYFSITAEPYLRIPTQGIGMGSVHLNSAGVLFSIGIQPFNNKKNK